MNSTRSGVQSVISIIEEPTPLKNVFLSPLFRIWRSFCIMKCSTISPLAFVTSQFYRVECALLSIPMITGLSLSIISLFSSTGTSPTVISQ